MASKGVYAGAAANDGTGQSLRSAVQTFNAYVEGVSVQDPDFGAVPNDSTAAAANTIAFRAAIAFAIANKTAVYVPEGVYWLSPDAQDYVLTCAGTSDGVNFGSLLIYGVDTGSRVNRIDTVTHETYTRGAVLKFTGTMTGKIALQTGTLTNNVRFHNLTLVGTGRTVSSIGVRHNAGASKFEMDNCTLQHWGTAIDIGGDFASLGDTHADFNVIRRVFVSMSDIGIKFNNFQGCVNNIQDCDIAARIPIWNAKGLDGNTPSPPVSVNGGFIQPLTEYGAVLLEGTVTSATGQTITVNITNKKTKPRGVDPNTLSIDSVDATIADAEVGMFVLAQYNCNATGSTRVPSWEVLNTITGINGSVLTVTGTVDATELAGKTVWLIKPAIGFYGSMIDFKSTRFEETLAEDLGFGPMLGYISGYLGGVTLRNCDVKLYSNTGDFNKHLPKIYHAQRYAYHGSPLLIEGGTWEVSHPKFEVTGTAGVHTKGVTWICEPLFLDHSGKVAEGVVREFDSHTSKARTYAYSTADLRSRMLQMGHERYEQRGGILMRPFAHRTTAPTSGVAGELFAVAPGSTPMSFYTIAHNAILGYYESTTPTATAAITIGEKVATITGDFTGIDRDQVITIAGAVTGARVLDIELSDDGLTRTIWLSAAATATQPTAAITAVAPSIQRNKFGSATATAAVMSLLGGSGGANILEIERTDGATSKFGFHLGGGNFTVRDETNSRDVWSFPTGDARIAAECKTGLRFVEVSTDPTAALLTSGGNSLDRVLAYMKNNKLVFAYNNAGTVTYLKFALDGSATTPVHDTTAP